MNIHLSATSPLKRILSYRKFAGKQYKILLLDSHYHIQNECRNALKRLGHMVQTMSFKPEDKASDLIQALLLALVSFKPDMLLSINHLGFDAQNNIGVILDDIMMPVAVWYVDSPFFVLRQANIPAPNMSSVFCWERTYLELLQQHGFADVHYLPLACDTHVMHREMLKESSAVHFDYGFVGDSTTYTIKKWHDCLTEEQQQEALKKAQNLQQDRHLLIPYLKKSVLQTSVSQAYNILATAAFLATGKQRLHMLKQLPQQKLHVFGDAGWQTLLPNAHCHPPVGYGSHLANIYQQTMIHLNATNFQMPSALNQRVFDIPIAGGFVLSDTQADMEHLFELGTEAVVYDNFEHLADLVDYYTRHPTERLRITTKACERIKKEHTYEHRLQKILTVLQTRHGTLPS